MTIPNPIEITPKASEEIKNIMSNKGIPKDYALRIGVKGGGGCGGASYFLGFDKKKETDEVYNIEGIEILLEKRQLMYLLDLKLDFEDRETERGFTFDKKG
jgi:iron-sulfur cluster assembly protein